MRRLLVLLTILPPTLSAQSSNAPLLLDTWWGPPLALVSTAAIPRGA